MTLSRHVDVDELLARSEDHPHASLINAALEDNGHKHRAHHSMAHSGRYQTEPIPKYALPKKGSEAKSVYQIITDELTTDSKPSANLASFVHTWMPEEGTRLVMENIGVNLVDVDEYPATQAIMGRCVSMLADLWHAPKERDENGKLKSAEGVATTGSSEAIMLGGLAMKKRWQDRRKAQGKSFKEPGPNIIFGSNAQVAIEKFAKYFDIEARMVPVSKESKYRIDETKIEALIDENTIGVIAILGSTYTGHYEPVQEICRILDDVQKKTGLDIPVHVDGASGGFVAPFVHPNTVWDFRLPRVCSINSSGHKFGLTYAGLGWVIFRDSHQIPKELIFELAYLGGSQPEFTFGLNFSRPAAPVLAQYFNFLNLGFEGYRNVAYEDLKNARILSRALEASGYYSVLSDIHRPKGGAIGKVASVVTKGSSDPETYEAGLPVVAFTWSDTFKKENPGLEQKWMERLLRSKGWIVPNYPLSPNAGDIEVLRVVVRENLSLDMIDQLVHDILSITEDLASKSSVTAHLAGLMSKDTHQASLQTTGGSAPQTHGAAGPRHFGRAPTRPEQGRGVRATGYAKQC